MRCTGLSSVPLERIGIAWDCTGTIRGSIGKMVLVSLLLSVVSKSIRITSCGTTLNQTRTHRSRSRRCTRHNLETRIGCAAADVRLEIGGGRISRSQLLGKKPFIDEVRACACISHHRGGFHGVRIEAYQTVHSVTRSIEEFYQLERGRNEQGDV